MSIVTSQQLTRYYEQYKSTDVTFNKEVTKAVGLVGKGVYIKVQDRQVPCNVFSSSLSSARVIASVPPLVMAALRQATNRFALRWCFKLPDKVEPITFFVSCRPTGFTHYAVQGPDVHFITLEFTQRPPDDLIQIIGSLLEAKFNSQKRRDERIIVNPETMKKLGLETREAELVVESRVCKCVLRDLSFSGAKVVVTGRPEMFANKNANLRFARSDLLPEMSIPASVRRVDEVGGRREFLAVSIEFTTEPPMSYKLLINSYVSTLRKAAQEAEGAQVPKRPTAEQPAPEQPRSIAEKFADGPEDAQPPAGSESSAPDIPAEEDPTEGGGKDPLNG